MTKKIFIYFYLIILIKCLISLISPEVISDFTTVDQLIKKEKKYERIKGCPDIYSINDNVKNFTYTQLTKISCLCGDSNKEPGVSINCIYGSTLQDLEKVLKLAKIENIPVHKIGLNGLVLQENETKSLASVFSSVYNENKTIPLEFLEIKVCQGATPLQISTQNTSDFKFNLPKLQHIQIEDCGLKKLPEELLQYSPNLNYISVPKNKIKLITKDQFGKSIESIKYINLEGNLLSNVEDGTFSQLKSLKELHIGEHNFASKTILKEIAKLENLENLDMTRIDGIDNEQQFSSKSIKKLILTGCNFKAINATNFGQLHALEELDLRVNLIKKINENSFLNLTKLKKLNMAGNFLRHFNNTKVWAGLTNLNQLDLGWNDFVQLNSSIFDSLTSKIKILDLRHNEKLKKIEARTFENLKQLNFLNLSHSALNTIHNETFDLTNLKVLDLSFNNISYIEPGSFNKIKEYVEYLNLSGNKLKTIDENLLNGMIRLKEIDISENPLECDELLYKIYNIINNKYKKAAKNSMEFELKNSKRTLCDRPYIKRGKIFLELEPEDFIYDKQMDTTKTPEATTTMTIVNKESNFTNFNWQQVTFMVGEEFNTIDTLDSIDEDAGKPAYDINTVKYGQRHYKKLSNTWFSAVVVIILIILTTICIIIIAKKKRSEIIKDNTSKARVATTTEL